MDVIRKGSSARFGDVQWACACCFCDGNRVDRQAISLREASDSCRLPTAYLLTPAPIAFIGTVGGASIVCNTFVF